MEAIKNFLFDLLVIIGLIAVILTILWWAFELLNRMFHLSKYIIMYLQHKRNEELYDIRNSVIVSKDGHISYSCVNEPDKKIEILNNGIKHIEDLKKILSDRDMADD